MRRLGTLISSVTQGMGMEEAMRFERLRKEWKRVFREPLSLHMSPHSLKNSELLVHTDSPVWLQQLTFFKADILSALAPFGVTTVRFKIGRLFPYTKNNPRQQEPPHAAPDPHAAKIIEETVSGLADDGVRESIRKAMERSFAGRGKRLR